MDRAYAGARRLVQRPSEGSVSRLSRPDWERAAGRLPALHRLGLKNLPTPRRVAWSLVAAAVTAVVAGVLLANDLAVVAVLFTLLALAQLIHAWERLRAIRTGRIGAGVVGRVLDHWLTGAAETGLDVALTRGVTDVVDALAELGSIAAGRTFAPKKRRWLDQIREGTEPALVPGEKRLATLRATVTAHGPRRWLMFVTFGLAVARYQKSGVLTLTDRRLLFHQARGFRGDRFEPMFRIPVTELDVAEWFKGLSAVERWHQILILRRADGSMLRLMFPSLWWRDEGRRVFELLASVSANPPPALARFWALPT